MKILVYEHICGGGFAEQILPPSLAAEGGLMLQALAAELAALAHVELIIPLDSRCQSLTLPATAKIIIVESNQSLSHLLALCDAFWPIAPESDDLLASLARMAQVQQKILLLSDADTLALCANKLLTCQHLTAQHIPVVASQLLNQDTVYPDCPQVIKPVDGLGCLDTRIVDNADDFQKLVVKAGYITQPWCAGLALSLSCLFKQGQAWLLTCNRQNIRIVDQHFQLEGCQVNITSPHLATYQQLIQRIAVSLPGLWGYIGIDLLETAEGFQVLEINPRLTTSYVGIQSATGINVAGQVLALLHSNPKLQPQWQRTISVTLT